MADTSERRSHTLREVMTTKEILRNDLELTFDYRLDPR